MTLKGIDIASYQATLIPANVDADFITAKATQGIKYVNPSFRGHADNTLKAGKLLGAYHYVSGGSPMDEAKHFYQAIKPYLGKTVLAVDWESNQNNAWGDLNYLSILSETSFLSLAFARSFTLAPPFTIRLRLLLVSLTAGCGLLNTLVCLRPAGSLTRGTRANISVPFASIRVTGGFMVMALAWI